MKVVRLNLVSLAPPLVCPFISLVSLKRQFRWSPYHSEYKIKYYQVYYEGKVTSLPQLRLSEARKVLIKMSQSSFLTLDHKLAATQTPNEVDVHQVSSLAATSDSSCQFDLWSALSAQPETPGDKSPHGLSEPISTSDTQPSSGTTCKCFSVPGSHDNSKNRTVATSMQMVNTYYKQNGKTWQLCTVVGLFVVLEFFNSI